MNITTNNLNDIVSILENKTLEYFSFDITNKIEYEDLVKINEYLEVDAYVRAYEITNEIRLGFDNNGNLEDYCIYYDNGWIFDKRKVGCNNFDGFLHTCGLKDIKSFYFENENKIVITCSDETRVSIGKNKVGLNLYIYEKSIN